jgi:hypothetical protein
MADTEDKVEQAIHQQIYVCFEFYHSTKDHRMYPAVEGGVSTLDITARKKSEESLPRYTTPQPPNKKSSSVA